MTASASSSSAAGPESGLTALMNRHHFLLRRLHSLSGIVPVGVFMCFHLFTNMQMAFGTFQHEVEFIHNMPALLFMEIFGIWLPIAFHAGLGIVYTFTGKPNTGAYKYADNWRYVLQRATGMIALVFIFLHIATLRWGWNIFGWYTPFFVYGSLPDGTEVELAHASTAIALQASWIVLALYAIGVLAAVFHFANGLWTAAITWGLTVSRGAQQRWGMVCAALFLGLAAFSITAIQAAWAYEPSEQEWAAWKAEVAALKADNGATPDPDPAITPASMKTTRTTD